MRLQFPAPVLVTVRSTWFRGRETSVAVVRVVVLEQRVEVGAAESFEPVESLEPVEPLESLEPVVPVVSLAAW